MPKPLHTIEFFPWYNILRQVTLIQSSCVTKLNITNITTYNMEKVKQNVCTCRTPLSLQQVRTTLTD